jgi:hypothetical protein
VRGEKFSDRRTEGRDLSNRPVLMLMLMLMFMFMLVIEIPLANAQR